MIERVAACSDLFKTVHFMILPSIVHREKRRLSQEKEHEQRQLEKKQRRDLEHLDLIKQQLEEELELKDQRRQRRNVVKEELAATLPPRLGRHKFEPASVQVATTDELGGSLRRVVACPMVALHRFRSLQHRGLIETRKPVVAHAG